MNVTFFSQNEIADELLKYAVIVARYGGHWIFCRHKLRDTWEIPGGHRETGEDIFETAKRELYEETGALDFDIVPICVYKVDEYGMLFFADVKKLSELPSNFEIGEIKLFDSLPQNLTYPHIQPYLYEQVQKWLAMQSSADELWDVYDEKRNLLGKTHRRGDPMGNGEYHLVVHIWLQNSNGEYLITKRSPNISYPNMWQTTGGSALAGDDSITAAIREVKEETGLDILPENGECVLSLKREDNFCDVWMFKQNFDISNVVYQESEICDAKFTSKEKIFEMVNGGTFVEYSYLGMLNTEREYDEKYFQEA